jgi:hypothetical protein
MDMTVTSVKHVYTHQRHSVGAAAPLLFEYRVTSNTEVSTSTATLLLQAIY